MQIDAFPARLHVLIARNCHTALVIRRGPSKHTGIFAWNRNNNSFTVSQWLKGRLYERRSDLSPSGKHWIYFAMNGQWESESQGAWTAVARAPWLKAMVMLTKGDCWHGGGLFLDDKQYWLNDGYGHTVLKQSGEVVRNETFQPDNNYGGECLNVYYNRLQRDGWKWVEGGKSIRLDSESWFEKELSKGWRLRKICHEQVGSPEGKGCYWDEHILINKNGETMDKEGWEWAEWLEDKLVFAEAGCLNQMPIKNERNLGKIKCLHDFNDYSFKNIQAPY